MSSKADNLNKLMGAIGDTPNGAGSFSELCKGITIRKNKRNAMEYARTEYSERLVLVPQCLRSSTSCRAEEEAAEYRCLRCGNCKIGRIAERAEELGFGGVRILKGGSAVVRIINELRPKAVLGIACDLEGALGMLECEKVGATVQFVPLVRDGCADTDVDLDEVLELMEFRQQ